MLWLIFLAASMWIVQCGLGIWQFKRFNRELKLLRREGRVAIGTAKGRLVAGVIVLLCIDDNCQIINGKKIQGLTIFAKVRDFPVLNGINLLELKPVNCRGFDKQLTKAVLNAVTDYQKFTQQAVMPDRVKAVSAVTDL